MKLTNKDLARWEELERTIKAAEAELKGIKDVAKLYGPSVITTKDYVVTINEQSRTALAGLEEVSNAVGRHLLEQYGLIKTTTYQICKLTKKISANINIVNEHSQSLKAAIAKH